MKGINQKKRKKPDFNFDHRKIFKSSDHVSRFNKPRERAEAILRVLG